MATRIQDGETLQNLIGPILAVVSLALDTIL